MLLMLFSDYHNHPQGHRDLPYSMEVLEPWGKYARESGLKDVALTDHGRYHPGILLDEFFKFKDLLFIEEIYFSAILP